MPHALSCAQTLECPVVSRPGAGLFANVMLAGFCFIGWRFQLHRLVNLLVWGPLVWHPRIPENERDSYLDASENSGTPQIIHFNRVFHYKPSILGYSYFWKHSFGGTMIHQIPNQRPTTNNPQPWRLDELIWELRAGSVTGIISKLFLSTRGFGVFASHLSSPLNAWFAQIHMWQDLWSSVNSLHTTVNI